jgi:biotin transport system substrate-specific component
MKNIFIHMPAKLIAIIATSLTNKLVQTIVSSWFIALCSHITIPFYPVPMTLQTFAIALISLLAPVEVAIGSVLFYVGYAVAGIPFLGGGAKGIAVLLGPTAGYIMGFFVMSATISLLMKCYPTSGIFKRLLFTFLGGGVLFLLGMTHLARLFNWGVAVKAGLLPFVFSEPVKYALAAYLSVFLQGKYLKK